ncbi:unnamed protein product [Caenorhabditis sp. 36 PRJEB53466]|nr:unnamed protein product [Caenorhabditis sp. 36 PRJEB53466]
MAGILPPDHIEHYKRQIDMKTEDLRFETITFIKNYIIVHNRLPNFPWTFEKSYQSLRLLSSTIGYRNEMLERLPTIIEHSLYQMFKIPFGYVPKADEGRPVNSAMITSQLKSENLDVDALAFLQQIYTYIILFHKIYQRFPVIPQSFTVGYRFLYLLRQETKGNYPLENLPNELRLHVIRVIGHIPDGYIPGAVRLSK